MVISVWCLALLAAYGTAEVLSDVDEVAVDFPTPKTTVEFIQEQKGCNCASATSKAYAKFKGDMKKITSLKEKADARANKAETEAQKQAGIARRCLAAEQLLSGDAKARRSKLRAHIKKEVSIVEQQYAAKAKQLAKQCSDKIAMARKDEAAKSGSEVDAAVKKEQLRMKKEIDEFAAQKAAFKLSAKRMKLRLKVELDNVQRKVTEAQKKQLTAEEALKKAEREIQRLEEKMKREAVLAKQKLDAVNGQLAAKVKECKSAQDATNIARDQAKKASQQTAHAQLAAKAAETAERVQVIKLQNKVGRAEAKEKAEADTIRNDKVELAKDKALLHESQSKEKKAQSEEIALAGAKAKAVAQQAKDAIAEGQTKGKLTVVLGKLKADKAAITELRKEMTDVRKQKEGGEGLELKAKELQKESDGYKARLEAKDKLMAKQVATKETELKVCMARSVGYQKQIAACIGAEKALKREELSMQALTKLSKEKL